ncbi:type III polyketide synthase [Pelagibius litoralis]|uniref:type III polyketide synthase n=1 Tax=Pelagibius litoralis TaxID=374515 RepID=UPI001F1145B6|nr:3-oxoacyl-[acyl-carrier-protein] synthase III C-terminal domain-containing protein [Pelagibius litoralis]
MDFQLARDTRAENAPATGKAVALTALATAVPPHILRQADVVTRVRSLFAGRQINIDRLLPAFANAGVETRRSCVPIEWYLEPSDWKTRNQLFIDNALDLFEDATLRCLDQAGLPLEAVDAIVTVSTTGIAVPSLDARLMDRLAFRRDVNRLPVFGLGCVGGVIGLSRAAALAKSRPGTRVLCLVAELCALTFRANDRSKSNVIATALFGDGAAALLLESPANPAKPGGSIPTASNALPVLQLTASGEYTWPASLDVMGWDVENDGLGVVFSRDIPALVLDRLGPVLDSFLADQGLSRSDIDGYVCHPGGAKVISALEAVFGLEDGNLTEARGVLRDFGNMSAVTVLFVLERMRAAGMKGRYVMTALGPGFTAGFQILEA